MKKCLLKIFIAALKTLLNMQYKTCSLFGRNKTVLLLSRQSDDLSMDYQLLSAEFERRGYRVVSLVGTLTKRNLLSYAVRVFKQVYYLARCRIVFLDGYDPVVGLLKFKSEQAENCHQLKNADLHDVHPLEPVIIQLWHAFGSFKKFAYQSIGTREGRPSGLSLLLNMHGNYSWVLCTGESCVKPFAEAFRYPIDRVVPLGRPEQDWLKNQANRQVGDSSQSVVFAPTLRRSLDSMHPLKDLYFTGEWSLLSSVAEVEWTFHPVESASSLQNGNLPTEANALQRANYVVTDYSSIVYEAYLLGKKAVFYVPDIEEYSSSPGLYLNPLSICPEITFTNEKDLITALLEFLSGKRKYPQEAFERFAEGAFCNLDVSATSLIVDFAIDKSTINGEK